MRSKRLWQQLPGTPHLTSLYVFNIRGVFKMWGSLCELLLCLHRASQTSNTSRLCLASWPRVQAVVRASGARGHMALHSSDVA